MTNRQIVAQAIADELKRRVELDSPDLRAVTITVKLDRKENRARAVECDPQYHREL